MTSPGSSDRSRLQAVLRLVRFPLVPTAVADSAAGYLIASPVLIPKDWAALGWLAPVSSCLYMAGMVFNDLADETKDRSLHPERPLPSGELTFREGSFIGFGLVVVGLAFAFKAGVALCSWMLLSAILGYTLPLKQWAIPGALCMGACRALNLAMGMAAASWYPWEPWRILANSPAPLILGGYVAIVTHISTVEERRPAASKWVAILLRGIIPLDAALVAWSGKPLAALGILALLPLALGLKRLLPRHE